MMNTLKKIAVAAAVTAAFSAPVHAVTVAPYDLGTVLAGGKTQIADINSYPNSFANSFVFVLGAGNGAAVQFASPWFGYTNYNYLPKLTLTLDGVGYHSEVVDFTSLLAGNAVLSSSFSGLVAGQSYSLNVAGDDSWNLSTRKYALTVAAVPEPEALGMLLAGLAVVGGMARRRIVNN